jgi:hypothetical protein
MPDHLKAFNKRKVPLGRLIGNLKGLVTALICPDLGWTHEFVSEWGFLEKIFALALDRKEQGVISDVEAVLNAPSNLVIMKNSIQRMQKIYYGTYG